MTTAELIEQLKAKPQDLEVIILWHGYQRELISVEVVEVLGGELFVRLVEGPRYAA